MFTSYAGPVSEPETAESTVRDVSGTVTGGARTETAPYLYLLGDLRSLTGCCVYLCLGMEALLLGLCHPPVFPRAAYFLRMTGAPVR